MPDDVQTNSKPKNGQVASAARPERFGEHDHESAFLAMIGQLMLDKQDDAKGGKDS